MDLKSKWIEYNKVILICILGSFITTYFTCQSCHTNFERYLWVTFFSSLLWISLWIGNEVLSLFISTKISWVEFPVKRLIVGVLSTVSFTVTIVWCIVWVWEKALNFSFGGSSGIIFSSLIITFIISLFLQGRGFLLSWKNAAVDAETAKKESIKAQYESLKSQVNPHFLFNSLNALTNLVYEDQDKAAKFIKQLSDVYRYVLDTRDREMVSLEEELRFLNAYLFLQQIRFREKLQVKINLNGVASQVAPLAFQMLIENAIKHNEISQDNPLLIHLYTIDNYLVVENNFQKKSVLKEDSPGIGLDNIRRRYAFLSDRPIEVTQTGKLFSVKLPVLKNEMV
jgi:sensor histidine kinase YesM